MIRNACIPTLDTKNAMQNYTLKDIALAVSGKLMGNPDVSVSHLIIDSRSAASPNDSIFFAIQGIHHDGHKFIADLYQKGIRSFVAVQKALPDFSKFADANFIFVENTLDALQSLAAFHRRRFSYPVVGITGSNGKTVVFYFSDFQRYGKIGS